MFDVCFSGFASLFLNESGQRRRVEQVTLGFVTPPSQAILPRTSAPPRNPKDYADFLDVLITRFGRYFEWIQLWDQPNKVSEWDRTLDPDWNVFCHMIGGAAYWMQQRGKRTLLAGMSPFDPPRSAPYPLPPGVPMYLGLKAASGAEKRGYHPFPYPTAVASRP